MLTTADVFLGRMLSYRIDPDSQQFLTEDCFGVRLQNGDIIFRKTARDTSECFSLLNEMIQTMVKADVILYRLRVGVRIRPFGTQIVICDPPRLYNSVLASLRKHGFSEDLELPKLSPPAVPDERESLETQPLVPQV